MKMKYMTFQPPENAAGTLFFDLSAHNWNKKMNNKQLTQVLIEIFADLKLIHIETIWMKERFRNDVYDQSISKPE